MSSDSGDSSNSMIMLGLGFCVCLLVACSIGIAVYYSMSSSGSSGSATGYSPVGCFLDKCTDPTQFQTNCAGRAMQIQGAATTADQCYSMAVANGSNYFALQDGKECYAGSDQSYAQYGAASNCSAGTGGYWGNSVYKINR